VHWWDTIDWQVWGVFGDARTGAKVFVGTVWLAWLASIDHHWHMLLGRKLQVLVVSGSTAMHKSSWDVTVSMHCGCELMHNQMQLGAGHSKPVQNAGQDETFCGG